MNIGESYQALNHSPDWETRQKPRHEVLRIQLEWVTLKHYISSSLQQQRNFIPVLTDFFNVVKTLV